MPEETQVPESRQEPTTQQAIAQQTNGATRGKHARIPQRPSASVIVAMALVVACVIGGIAYSGLRQAAIQAGNQTMALAESLVEAIPVSPDRTLVHLHSTALDGLSMDEKTQRHKLARALVSSDVDYVANIKAMDQNESLPGGCEIVSLVIVLDSMGIEATPEEIADDYLEVDDDYLNGYAGSPYFAGGGFAAGIVKAANLFLKTNRVDAQAYDLTGSTFDSLLALTKCGYPVLVWTTMLLDEPYFSVFQDDEDEANAWYDNEHCVVLYGMKDDVVLVSDPLEGLVERDAKTFADVFEMCGSRAALVA